MYTLCNMKDPVDIQYKLKYRNAKGTVKDYSISAPFESMRKDGEKIGFVAYSYGRGIRSFRNDRVLNMEPVDATD